MYQSRILDLKLKCFLLISPAPKKEGQPDTTKMLPASRINENAIPEREGPPTDRNGNQVELDMLAADIAVGRYVCAGGLLGRRGNIRWSDRGNVYGFAPLLDVGDSLLDSRKAGIAESINAIIQDIQVEIRLRRIDGAEFHFLRRLDLAPARLKDEVRLPEGQLDLAGPRKARWHGCARPRDRFSHRGPCG